MESQRYIILTLSFRKQDDRWTAYCEELGTATFGHTLEKAREKIEEAVFLHLNALEEVGEQERFFRENGIVLHTRKPTKDITVKASPDKKTFVQPYVAPTRELAHA